MADIGRAALDHWLREAARLAGEERQAALERAREVAGMIGVPRPSVFSRDAT
jgi:hypothetical protein